MSDVLARVHAALQPDRELKLFSRHPSYDAENERLAMAIKRGELGALQGFVEFHLSLVRKSSRKLIRWFNMVPKDAEQTESTMIGLLESARRFDPELGY